MILKKKKNPVTENSLSTANSALLSGETVLLDSDSFRYYAVMSN